MNIRWLSWLLLILKTAESLSQDIPQKSSKLSDFKTKLAKTDLSKLSGTIKRDDSDVVPATELGISLPPEYANETVKKDHHTYYNSTFYSNPDDAKPFWINLEEFPEKHVVTHEKLSDSYRQATTVELTFDFPFYGSPLRNVTIATGGFLYMGDYLHNWIAATQYVAPLMANFDTRLSTNSVIKYADNGTAFIVQWEKVSIQNRQSDGAFTFQVTLLQNGDIVFAYKDIPFPVSSISDSHHPVKVGLSDAYILEKSILYIRRKTVYEYNRIHITDLGISNNTVLYFTALPTCNTFKNCSTCLSSGSKLECNWCEVIQRCSDGIDRQRQSWIDNGCTASRRVVCPAGKAIATTGKSEIYTYTGNETVVVTKKPSTSKSASSKYNVDVSTQLNDMYDRNEAAAHFYHEEKTETQNSVSAGAIATILVFLVVIVSVSVWIYYAYKNPQSSSGQFLIKYRPSQWVMKKDTTVAATNSRHL